MNSMSGLVHRKRFGFSSETRFILALFFFTSLLLLTGIVSSLRIAVLLFGLVSLVLTLRTKNVFISLLLVSIFTLPFFNPNKYYTVLAIRGLKLLVEFRGDYLLGYGVNISNIFIFLSMVALVRERVLKRGQTSTIFTRPLKLIILSAVAFFVVGLGASLKYSPFPEASIIWLLQYMQVFVLAFAVFYFFVKHKEKFSLIFATIFASISLQSVISLWQYLRQSSVGLPIEFTRIASFFATGLDEINTLFRVSGTFHFANQLALIMLVMIILLAPCALRVKNKLYLLGCFLGLTVIVLTQSRSIWIAATIAVVAFLRVYRKDIDQLVKKLGGKKLLLFGAAIFTVLSYIVIPRILLSFNAFYEGAGIPVRVRMAEEAVEAIGLNPIIGYGVGTNEYLLHSMFPNGVMAVFPAAVHLGFLQLALEVGILGLTFFLIPQIYVLRRLFGRTLTNNKRGAGLDYTFSFIVGLSVFFVYYLFQPHVGIVEFPYLGLILGFGIISIYPKL